ncbi:hypothetical protein [Photobacterium profundum]|uniref:Uncharacterized protein n=1 Tax=Photobacterium profundum (strain SS9) TaxID=298386 RepID=Q6LQP9_PHOPR|nr:hypothetical protein [Photobacterium profundum]CAG20377.1 hypothetical protein PBPRA1974 [Photobacterium profundum SS9]
MSENTYDNSINKNISKTKIFSPTQVACGTIGGPVGLIYFLHSNFSILRNDELKKKTLVYGAAFLIVLIIALPFLPEEVPSTPFTVLYIVIARLIADKYQMTKSAIVESNEFEFHSNWRVFLLGLLCLVGSMLIIAGPLIILSTLGVLEL